MQLIIDPFLQALNNWHNAKVLLDRLTLDIDSGDEREKQSVQQMERTAAQLVESTLRLVIQEMRVNDPSMPFIMGPGPERTAYPPIGSAMVPLCECGHSRDQHLKLRLNCNELDCGCVEFKKDLAPNLSQR